jgi:tetratricopeptide (TPR) repeat protein
MSWKRCSTLLLISIFITTGIANAQVSRIVIPAGTPEDQALQQISNEQDAAKKQALLEEFVTKFSGNQQAVAYGNWQLLQNASAVGENEKALDYGQKALTAMPNNMDILVSVAGVAQQLKKSDVAVDCAFRGAAAYNGIDKAAKPADTTDEAWESQKAEQKRSGQNSYEYLETTAYNVIVAEQDAKTRMAWIDKYIDAFPQSRFEDSVTQLAIYSLIQTQQMKRLNEFADKALAKNPNSVGTLAILATALSQDPSNSPATLAKAKGYAEKAISVGKADDPEQQMSVGMAHSALGIALLKEDKMAAGIQELKAASPLVKADPTAHATALYYLGFAYAKTNKLAEAKQVLSEAVTLDSPLKEECQKLLTKVEAGPAKRR